MRNFGIMSDRQPLGGASELPAANSTKQYNRADLFQSGNLPDYRDLGRGPFIQWVIDFTALCFAIIFICSLACSIPLAIFLMFFASF